LEKNENDFEALLQRGHLYLRQRNFVASEADLDRAARMDASSAQVHYVRSKVYAAKLDTTKQRQELFETLRLGPENFPARVDLADLMIVSNNPKAALQTLDEAPEAQKSTLPFFISRNWALIATGDLKPVRAGLDKVMQLAKTPELQLQDAVLKLINRDWAGAGQSLEPVLRADPEDVRALAVFGQAMTAQNQRAAATERIRQIVSLRPRSIPVQLFWAQWLLDDNQRTEARQALQTALALDPKHPVVLTLIAGLHVGERRYDEARTSLNALLAMDHRNPDALMLLAEVEEAMHKPVLAMDHYRKVLTLNGRHVRALNNLAMLLSRDSTKLDDAVSLAQKAKELAPQSPYVLDTLGWIYYRKGLYSLAAVELERAVADGQRPTSQYHLGLTYNRLGDTTKGGRLIATALAKEPKLADTEIP
jgi:tetratricopeptide (TPR) repeat protein